MSSSDDKIRSRLSSARLPAMPQILLKLLEHCQNDDSGVSTLAELIAKDPGITSKIFAIANSSAYQRSGRKVGLQEALIVIGLDMVKTLIISESVFQIFNTISHSDDAALHRFWKHSLGAAVVAREIALRMSYQHIEEAYLAGLLHDVGRLALLKAAPGEYAASFQAADDASLCAIELRTLQITHAEAGAWLIEQWELDSFMADSVLYHHESASRLSQAHPLIRIVKLAHMVSQHGADNAALDNAGALCGLDNTSLTEIGARAVEQVRQAAEFLGIDLAIADELPEQIALLTARPDPMRERLSGEVSSMLLASNIAPAFANRHGEDDVKRSILRSSRILFDFDDAVFLMVDTKKQALVGCSKSHHYQRLDEIALPMGGDCVIAHAIVQNQPVYIQNGAHLLSVSEEQLLRVLRTDVFVALPLVTDGKCFAILIGGFVKHRLRELQGRERFLLAFAKQAAGALATLLTQQHEKDDQIVSIAQTYADASRQMAHEVNNPLSIIKNYLSILDRKMQRNEPVAGEISILNEEIDRVGKIVDGLADLQVIQGETKSGQADVNKVAESVVKLLRHTEFVPPSVHIVTAFNDQPGSVFADADAIRQILLNLLMNSIQAMPGGGAIDIVNMGQVNRDGRLYLELSIRDTGPGIEPDRLATLFIHGGSSKPGDHRGQGLVIVQKLVREIDGLILCRSTSNGTIFDIFFPLLKAG